MNNSNEKTELDREQRVHPRHKINLNSSILITASRNTSINNKEQYLFLQGQLLDVSRSGLAVLISNNDKQELDILGNDLMMRLLLPLPVKAIELEVAPVRYKQLDESQGSKILMGAQITNMNARDRIMFMQFINDYETQHS